MNKQNLPKIAIVIPARYGSTRLPAKPLADIAGKPMIQHVYERAKQVTEVQHIIVATDHVMVRNAVIAFGGQCVMTSTDHPSGTDRLVEVMQTIDADIYINLQGDEPLIRPDDIRLLAQVMIDNPHIPVGTLCHSINSKEALNPNTVKVVLGSDKQALYFSRSPIPYPRDADYAEYFKHIGVYAYTKKVLQDYSNLPIPNIENAEKLEQLRLLTNGIKIHAFCVEETAPGVDTPECLEKVRAIMAGKPIQIPTLADIKLVITDVDGVLTDGGIYYDESGECQKRFHVRDGLGIRLLIENGINVAILSGRDSPTLRKRIKDLGIQLFSLGVKDKARACYELMQQANVSAKQTACIGDDSIDLPAFEVCGLSYAVADAESYVKNKATYTLNHNGGYGAFRELADAILEAQNKQGVFTTAEGFTSVMNNPTQ